jgi:hypothetical protein
LGVLSICAGGEGREGQPTRRPEEAAALVRQLGDEEYPRRKRAFEELAVMGRAAEPALRDGLREGDAEVRRQCDRLLALARRSDVEAALDAFLQNADDRPLRKLAAWPRFAQAFGTDPEARSLFVEMHTAELPLLEALGRDPGEVGARLAGRCRQLQELLSQRLTPAASVAGRGTVAALLFLATDDRVTTDSNAAGVICSLLYQPAPTQWLHDSPGARRLLAALAEKHGDPSTQQQILYLFGNLRMKEGLGWAVKLARARETPEFNRGLALSLIGCLGNEDHLGVLEPLLADSGQVTAIHFGNGPLADGRSVVQVRDVALAMTIQLKGQNPGDFGFNDIRAQGANPVSGARPYYWPYYCGFRDNADREAAVRKWQQHEAKQKGKGE